MEITTAHILVRHAKANYCLHTLVEKWLVKPGNLSETLNKRDYAYIPTPRGLEKTNNITLGLPKGKEAKSEAIQRESDNPISNLESPQFGKDGD